jgi:hypothetical protein
MRSEPFAEALVDPISRSLPDEGQGDSAAERLLLQPIGFPCVGFAPDFGGSNIEPTAHRFYNIERVSQVPSVNPTVARPVNWR